MCGIFAVLGDSKHTSEKLEDASNKGARRGPEFSILKQFHLNNNLEYTLGFHRLAINGLDEESHQPITFNGCKLICNGEIYNYKQLYTENDIVPKTNSDCEIILHLYKRYGIEGTLSLIDGVFAFVLVDEELGKAYIARDAFGVRPMFMLTSENYIGISSEMKQLVPIANNNDHIEQYKPGHFSVINLDLKTQIFETKCFSYFPFMKRMEIPYPSEYTIYKYFSHINSRLRNAVKKRVDNTDRPIACLLSGGLDSSLITALVSTYVKDKSNLETYSIGLEGSEDLMYAQKVADYLGTKHTSIVVSESDFFNAIPEVIYAIESYDTTTVRASVGNFLVAKYISENSEAKVIFNGDGSDEVTGGYLYFHKCPNSTEFSLETRRLLQNIHYFDVLRSDRCISYHGLEARTPFLDREFVEHYMTFPKEVRNHSLDNKCEKYLLRQAFTIDNILPQEILWRTKEAFSDGVSSHKKSWYETIQENVLLSGESYVDKNYLPEKYNNVPKTMEQQYYRNIFEEHYKNRGNVIPYFWMPKYTEAIDCSARTLNFYESLVKK